MNLPTYQKKPVPCSPITSYGDLIDPKDSLRACEVGACFVVDEDIFRRRVIGFANRLKIKVKTRKNEAGKYDIWRVE